MILLEKNRFFIILKGCLNETAPFCIDQCIKP